MKIPNLRAKKVVPALLVAGLIGTGVAVKETIGSDHQQTPLTELNPRLDLTDVWVFPGSTDGRIVLGMTIASPLIGDRGARFDPNALYQFKIDNDQNGIEDLVIQFSFDEMQNGVQMVDVMGPAAPRAPVAQNLLGPISGLYAGGVRDAFLLSTPTVRRGALNTNLSGNLGATTGAQAGQMQVFAGLVDDPFFVDLVQFFRILPDRRPTSGPLSHIGGADNALTGRAQAASAFRPNCGANGTFEQADDPNNVFASANGCAVDFLRGFNALAIVVELDEAQLVRGKGGSDPELGIWATISR